MGPWQAFPWHSSSRGSFDTHKPHSSQALAIDVLGTLIAAPAKDYLLKALAFHWGLQPAGGWQLHLEWLDPQNTLREHRRSQIDAVAYDSKNLVFFECKFTEQGAGACSQPNQVQGVRQCNGNYELQTNPRNGRTAHCALSGKGIRYWEIIPAVFNLDPHTDHQPCPFAGTWYQWMRNLVLCRAVAQERGLAPAFVILYAGGPFPIAQELDSDAWRLFLAALLAALLGLEKARSGLREAGARGGGAMARALQISLAGYLISSLFLHGDFERYLWLLFGMSGALLAMARMGLGAPDAWGHEG